MIQVISPKIHYLAEEGMRANHYAIETDTSWILFEAAISPEEFYAQTRGARKPVSHIFLTHGHIDHIAHLNDWLAQEGVVVHFPLQDSDFLRDVDKNASRILLGEDRQFQLPQDLFPPDSKWEIENYEIESWHTPGHTPGSCCYLIRKVFQRVPSRPVLLITGDTVIGYSVGRTDLRGGDVKALFGSLQRVKDWLHALSDQLVVGSGHGPLHTVEEICRNNQFLERIPPYLG